MFRCLAGANPAFEPLGVVEGAGDEIPLFLSNRFYFFLFPTRVLFLRRSAPFGARHLWFVTRWWGPYFSSRRASSEPLIL